jgi:aldoxime dehydratase
MDLPPGSRKRMPSDWTPPSPAWAADFSAASEPLIMAYFGTEVRSAKCEHYDTIGGFLTAASDAPGAVEHAKYVNREGCETIISIAYWTSRDQFEAWRASSGFSDWWNNPARLQEPNGYFYEVLKLPPNNFETLFSTQHPVGVGKIAAAVTGPIQKHNYWGSMRDRIEKSATDDLVSQYGTVLPRLGRADTIGKRLRVKAPGNLAIIRSGQDWTDCKEAELATYDESIRPVLAKAMAFLLDHPDETGCCELRFAQETDAHGTPLERTFGLGYFLTLAHLEQWASSHPTHLEIFKRFIAMLQQNKFQVNLRLWHEVSVLPSNDQLFEYINCSPGTGLLPYFSSSE